MKSVSFKRLQKAEYLIALSVVGFVVILALASFFAGSGEVLKYLTSISLPLISFMLLLSLLNYFLRAFRWHIFSKHLQIQVPLKSTILYYFSGFSMTTTPGKIGEALRLWFLQRCHHYNYSRVGPLFVGDRLSDMHAMLVLILIGLTAFSEYVWLSFMIFIIIILFTYLFIKPDILIGITGLFYKWSGKRAIRLFAKVRRTLRLTANLFSWKIFSGTLLIAILGWLAETGAFFILLRELGANVNFLHATFIFSFSMVMGALSMLPGGLGGVEASMIALLVALGVDIQLALVATAVIRLTTLWFAVFIGFTVLPFAMKKVHQFSSPESTVDDVIK